MLDKSYCFIKEIDTHIFIFINWKIKSSKLNKS